MSVVRIMNRSSENVYARVVGRSIRFGYADMWVIAKSAEGSSRTVSSILTADTEAARTFSAYVRRRRRRHESRLTRSTRDGDTGGDCMNTLLTIDEAAKRIHMSHGWIKKAIRTGELDVVRFGKRCVRIREQELEVYVRRKIEGNAQSLDRALEEIRENPFLQNHSVTNHDQPG